MAIAMTWRGETDYRRCKSDDSDDRKEAPLAGDGAAAATGVGGFGAGRARAPIKLENKETGV
jgi:hypothetical protein